MILRKAKTEHASVKWTWLFLDQYEFYNVNDQFRLMFVVHYYWNTCAISYSFGSRINNRADIENVINTKMERRKEENGRILFEK